MSQTPPIPPWPIGADFPLAGSHPSRGRPPGISPNWLRVVWQKHRARNGFSACSRSQLNRKNPS